MRLQFVTIGQNLNWPPQVLREKKNTKGIYDSRFSSSNKDITFGDEDSF